MRHRQEGSNHATGQDTEVHDAIIVGGGPAGSTCALWLRRGGLRVRVLDRATFPRVKLCAGWVSDPIWDVLELAPRQYPHGLWEWHRCHVAFRGRTHAVPAHGYFIRRYELDAFLLERSRVPVTTDHAVRHIEHDGAHWIIDGVHRCTYLVGAGGAHCPVARLIGPARAERPVGVRELEIEASTPAVAAHRAGADGEPELLLHEDLRGYSWNVPKGAWVNIGCGTADAREVLAAWTAARAHFEQAGHVPPEIAPDLDRMSGWAYFLYHERSLDACERDNAFLVGDALGLAHPLTAEGILPAALSGRLCAEAILSGEPGRYGLSLRTHPLLAEYRLIQRARARAGALRPGRVARALGAPVRSSALATRAAARAFAWMFSGRRLPRPVRALGRWL